MAASRSKDYVFYRKYLLNIMLLYKGRQDLRMFIEILLSLFTVSIFGFFAIKPTSVTIANLITDIQSKEDTISKMDQKIQNLTAAQQNVVQNQSLIDILNLAIPEKVNLDIYIRQIEGLATRNKVSLDSISSSNVAIIGAEIENVPEAGNKQILKDLPLGAKSVKISTFVSGSFSNLLAFLKEVENLRRPIAIDSIDFVSRADQNQKKVLVMTINGRLPLIKN